MIYPPETTRAALGIRLQFLCYRNLAEAIEDEASQRQIGDVTYTYYALIPEVDE